MLISRLKQLPEFFRYIIVGIIATGIHYVLYYALQWIINVNVAYTTGYLLSLFGNFYLTACFTFGQSPSWKKAFGFGSAHLVNYFLHILLLNLFLWLGVPKVLAPFPVFAIAIPVNFLLIKFAFKRR